MQITETQDPQGRGHDAWEVLSSSGSTYTVRYEGLSGRWDREGSPEIDPEYDAGSYSCTCPAAKFHPDRDCKHVRAVQALVEEAA